MVLFASDLTDT